MWIATEDCANNNDERRERNVYESLSFIFISKLKWYEGTCSIQHVQCSPRCKCAPNKLERHPAKALILLMRSHLYCRSDYCKRKIACAQHSIHVRAVFIHHIHIWCDDVTWMWGIAACARGWRGVSPTERGSCAKNRFKCWIMHTLLALTLTVYQPRPSLSLSLILRNVQRVAAFNTPHTHAQHGPTPYNIPHDKFIWNSFLSALIGKTVVRAQHSRILCNGQQNADVCVCVVHAIPSRLQIQMCERCALDAPQD